MKKQNHVNQKLQDVSAITKNQENIFSEFRENQNLFITGPAGTGKTFLALFLLMQKYMKNPKQYRSCKVIRSIVPTRDIGYLPGNLLEKIAPYEETYRTVLSEMFQCGSVYDEFKKKGIIEFDSTSFLRGQTWTDTLIFVDEVQNMSFHEMNTIMGRIGEGCTIIISGDSCQCDFVKETSGFSEFSKKLNNMKSFSSIELTNEDIVRSGIVREWIEA